MLQTIDSVTAMAATAAVMRWSLVAFIFSSPLWVLVVSARILREPRGARRYKLRLFTMPELERAIVNSPGAA
jgi:hypothetical protein